MILIIDNYDSFTYNLYQIIGELCDDIQVLRNDALSVDALTALPIDALIISPGPGYPSDAGISIEVVRCFAGKFPILGVCLGHQAIAEAYGGRIVPASQLMHGKSSQLTPLKRDPIFDGLTQTFPVARYHSLIVERETLPDSLEILAADEFGQIMAIRHKEDPVYGLQFHPESILTPDGKRMLANFLRLIPGLTVKEVPAQPLDNSLKDALKPYIYQLIEGQDLTRTEAFAAMSLIMSGQTTDAQIGSFLTALRMKGETIEEITGFAQVMRQKGKSVGHDFPVIDIVGTGGDLANTFNISTTAAFVIAGAGGHVAKHGNRSVSSKSGAADVLEALNIKLDLSPEQAAECLKDCEISFLFAPSFHNSMRFAALPRKEIGVRSVFNILGPLANPAASDYILLGVYDEALMEPMAQVLMNLGIKGAMLVHGEDGLDEISLSSPTRICEVNGHKLIKYTIAPEDYGFERVPLTKVRGGNAADNADILLSILDGSEQGPKRHIVLLNAGCALYISGTAQSIEDGIELARNSIDSGRALKKLHILRDKLAAFSPEDK